MKIKLSYFLGKRQTTLEKYCKSSDIKSHSELELNLLEHRVECPTHNETRSIFNSFQKKAVKPAPVKKKEVPQSKKQTKTTKTQKVSSKKIKTWSS
jgi:deoxyribodipyrimidine photolyase